MKETLLYSLIVTSSISTADNLSRLMSDDKFKSRIEQEVKDVICSALVDSLGECSIARFKLEVEIASLKEAHTAIGPPP